MAKQRNVALLIETSNDYARGLLKGIMAYIREHERWSIYLPEHDLGRIFTPPAWLSHWQCDGVIVRIENKKIAKAIGDLKVPAVDVSAACLVPSIPHLATNDQAFGRIAAEHLLERGFKHFAYCGDDRFLWSDQRGDGFAAAVTAAGYECFRFDRDPARHNWDQQEDDIARWIQRLPKPLGIMSCHDSRGQQVLAACRSIRVPVPDEVAVIGVDNDEILCHLADPPLTSVIPNSRRNGYEAAALLDRMLSGETIDAATETRLFDPMGIVTRQSTDVLAVEDREISAAVRFIRRHACEGINVNDVLEQVPLSRRVLESRFKQLFGQTPHEQIVKIRLNRAKELLSQTDLPLAIIAQRTGFSHVAYLGAVFKKSLGIPPGEYRQEMQT